MSPDGRDWSNAPLQILEHIFSLLPLKNAGRCAQVCPQWNYAFRCDGCWKKFTFRDGLLVKRRFTSHAGWQYALDHMKMRQFIPIMVRRWRELEIQSVSNIFNLYDFIQKITNFTEFYERNNSEQPLGCIRTFRFEWKLHITDKISSDLVEEKDIGTGGEILRAIRNLLSHLHGLKEIDIQGLQLSWNDAQLLMCEVLEKFQQQIFHLSLLNLTLYPSSLLHFGLFLNLRSLTLSPLNVFDNTLQLVAALQKLKHFRIVQDEKSSEAIACTASAWKDFTETNQGRTKVYLIMRGKPKEPLLIQPKAPVYAIIMERSCGQLTHEQAEQICDNYSFTLNRFCQLGLERMKRGKLEKQRVDRPIVDIATRCHNLQLLCVRERLSAGTALILAIISKKNRFELHLRENGLLKRISWCRSDLHILGLDIDFNWLRKTVKDFENLNNNVAAITGMKTTVLSDKRYKDSFK